MNVNLKSIVFEAVTDNPSVYFRLQSLDVQGVLASLNFRFSCSKTATSHPFNVLFL